ncbi:MAG: hypothetical protein R6U17_02680 [Thermoplasmata archaeon]
MAVRNERLRYIGFELEGRKIPRDVMISAIRASFESEEYEKIKPWLTVFDDNKGIVRCRHKGKERTKDILNSMKLNGESVRTVVSSGSIKKVKERLFNDV